MKKTRTRRSARMWQELISEQSRSGETNESFCAKRKIPLRSFEAARRKEIARSFFEVRTAAEVPSRTWESEVEFPNGVILRMSGTRC